MAHESVPAMVTTSEITTGVRLSTPRIEHNRRPVGIDVLKPRISWIVESAPPGWRQEGYELTARAEVARVSSRDSVLVPWPFAPIGAGERVEVRVRAYGGDGSCSDWSEPTAVEGGLLNVADVRGDFVSPAALEDLPKTRAWLLRRAFDVAAPIVQARLYSSAHGVYEAELNARPVNDEVLAPGWTSYGERLRYQTTDVTDLIRPGRNVIGLHVGNGWYRGRLGWSGMRAFYGDDLAGFAQLEIDYSDGTRQVVCTDSSWESRPSWILSNDLYDGEHVDGRLIDRRWTDPAHADSHGWGAVRTVHRDPATLVAPLSDPVREQERIRPVRVIERASGRAILDFAQNLVGRVRLRLDGRGHAGETITIRHAEVLVNGELAVRPLRSARATDEYIIRGDAEEVWEPKFTFHGFRYAEVTGWPGGGPAVDAEAVVLHSDLARSGWFECSDPLLKRFHENVVWGMKGNFLDVPTDCPQRDERLGWTGDIQVFAPTALYLYRSAGFLTSWLRDLAVDQRRQGGVVPHVVPNVLPGVTSAAAAWGDAAVIVPWEVYQHTGDLRLLLEQYRSMREWVEAVHELTAGSLLWNEGEQYGDWLDPLAPPDDPFAARTPPGLVATAYFAHSARLLAASARLIGEQDDADRFAALSADIRAAFRTEYVGEKLQRLPSTQTAMALALQFDLVEDRVLRRRIGRMLAEQVRQEGHRVGTGFVGTPIICDALTEAGYLDDAFALLLQRECPSWLYPVTMGATTVWERWDSLLPDGTVNPGEMTSFNHYALGAVADWMHRTIGGITPRSPGYRQVEIRPRFPVTLDHASTSVDSPYGLIESSWRVEDGTFTLRVSVPHGIETKIVMPSGATSTVTDAGIHVLTEPRPAP